MEQKIKSIKGFFGYKLSENPYKRNVGKTYTFKATANGISVYRQGAMVAENLESISCDEDLSFCFGYKDGRKICFDPINKREFDTAFCSSWKPNMIIATDGTRYMVSNNIIHAKPYLEKAVVEDGKINVNGGYHLIEDGSKISLSKEDGVIMLKKFTTDRNAKFSYSSQPYGSALNSFFTIKDDGKTRLINTRTEKQFFETKGENNVSCNSVDYGKTYAILDKAPDSLVTDVYILDKNDKVVKSLKVTGLGVFVAHNKEENFSYIGFSTSNPTDISYLDLDGNNITQKMLELQEKHKQKVKNDSINEERERRKAQENAQRKSAERNEKTNMLMGASLLGSMPATGTAVIINTAIARQKRKHNEELKSNENLENENKNNSTLGNE